MRPGVNRTRVPGRRIGPLKPPRSALPSGGPEPSAAINYPRPLSPAPLQPANRNHRTTQTRSNFHSCRVPRASGHFKRPYRKRPAQKRAFSPKRYLAGAPDRDLTFIGTYSDAPALSKMHQAYQPPNRFDHSKSAISHVRVQRARWFQRTFQAAFRPS